MPGVRFPNRVNGGYPRDPSWTDGGQLFYFVCAMICPYWFVLSGFFREPLRPRGSAVWPRRNDGSDCCRHRCVDTHGCRKERKKVHSDIKGWDIHRRWQEQFGTWRHQCSPSTSETSPSDIELKSSTSVWISSQCCEQCVSTWSMQVHVPTFSPIINEKCKQLWMIFKKNSIHMYLWWCIKCLWVMLPKFHFPWSGRFASKTHDHSVRFVHTGVWLRLSLTGHQSSEAFMSQSGPWCVSLVSESFIKGNMWFCCVCWAKIKDFIAKPGSAPDKTAAVWGEIPNLTLTCECVIIFEIKHSCVCWLTYKKYLWCAKHGCCSSVTFYTHVQKRTQTVFVVIYTRKEADCLLRLAAAPLPRCYLPSLCSSDLFSESSPRTCKMWQTKLIDWWRRQNGFWFVWTTLVGSTDTGWWKSNG